MAELLACEICGGPLNSNNVWGICERTPECRMIRARRIKDEQDEQELPSLETWLEWRAAFTVPELPAEFAKMAHSFSSLENNKQRLRVAEILGGCTESATCVSGCGILITHVSGHTENCQSVRQPWQRETRLMLLFPSIRQLGNGSSRNGHRHAGKKEISWHQNARSAAGRFGLRTSTAYAGPPGRRRRRVSIRE